MAVLLRASQKSPIATLHLGHNKIGDVGAIALGESLAHNSELCSLGLAANRIGDFGAVALATMVRQHPHF